MLFSGTYSCWLIWSISTAWRCEKVPRWQSSPESRTRWPSAINEPNASASPVAQSMPSPLSNIARLASSWRVILGLASKSAGTVQSARPTSASASAATPVISSDALRFAPGCFMPDQLPSSQSALFGL